MCLNVQSVVIVALHNLKQSGRVSKTFKWAKFRVVHYGDELSFNMGIWDSEVLSVYASPYSGDESAVYLSVGVINH